MMSFAVSSRTTSRRVLARRELIRRELARRRLLDWCRYVDSGYMSPPHIELLAEHLEKVERGEIRRLYVEMPPRHGKSEMVSVNFPPWYLGRNPDKRVILASYASELAVGFSRRAKARFSEYGQIFGQRVSRESSAAYRWDLAGKRGGMFAIGVDGGSTGKGASLFINDDLVKDRKEADSESRRNDIWAWLNEVARTRLEPGGAMVVVGTRWHEDDPIGRIRQMVKRGEEEWVELRLPAEAEENDAIGRAVGAPLWPERYDEAALENIKATIGQRAWLALFQQRPTVASGNIFKRAWLKRYQREDLPRFDRIVLSWDCSFKDEHEAKSGNPDYVVGQVWGAKGPRRYLLDQVRSQMAFPETLRAIKGLSDAWPRRAAILIEDKANGSAVISTIKRVAPGVIAVEPEGGKIARANAVSSLVEAGDVWVPRDIDAPWVEEFVDEVCGFPRKKFDDQVDCMTQALNYMHDGSDWLADMMRN